MMFDSFIRLTDLDSRKQLQCNDCHRLTIHVLEAKCSGEWNIPYQGGDVSGGTDFSLFRCGACDNVCFEKSSWDTESVDHDDCGAMILAREDVQYPPPSSADFTFNTDYTPSALDTLIEEMMYTLAGGKLGLATVGLRMIIEYIVDDKKCSGKSLETKIDDLLTKTLVDEDQRKLLHKVRKKGNSSAHKGIAMSMTEMVAGIGVVDLLLERLYNGPGRHADAIKKAEQAFKD